MLQLRKEQGDSLQFDQEFTLYECSEGEKSDESQATLNHLQKFEA